MSRIPVDRHAMYERIWDESDYVIPPAENSAFFVMTNMVLTPNQTRTSCPEDHTEMPGLFTREPMFQIQLAKAKTPSFGITVLDMEEGSATVLA